MEDQRDNPNIIGSEIIIYQTEDGHTKIDVKFEDETVQLTQAKLCELYQTSKSNISEHTFKDKRRFMETEFSKQNNNVFGYERFEYLYLEDTMSEKDRLTVTYDKIRDFFKGSE